MMMEGMSRYSIARAADASINTVTKLLEDVGAACCEFQDKAMRKLTIALVRVDEIWAFIGAKQKNVLIESDPELGRTCSRGRCQSGWNVSMSLQHHSS